MWTDTYCRAHECAVRVSPSVALSPQQTEQVVGQVMEQCEPDRLVRFNNDVVAWLKLLSFRGNKSLPVVYIGRLAMTQAPYKEIEDGSVLNARMSPGRYPGGLG